MNQQVAIKTENLGKMYTSYQNFLKRRKVLALKNLTLEVKRGEIFALVGLNAAGKTTVLKILLGLVRPSWGKFEILGEKKADTTIRKKLGYLSEEPQLYEFFSVREFLIFCGKLFGLNKSDRVKRVEQLLKLVQIDSAAETRVGELSKGMNQRLAIASSLINNPEILLLDEPLSGLDPVGRKLIKEAILNFRKKGGTVFFSSHILAEVEGISDRIGILHQGRLFCVERVESVLSHFHSLEDFFFSQIGTNLQEGLCN